MFCENCGKQIPDGYRLCAECSAQVVPAPAEQRTDPGATQVLTPDMDIYRMNAEKPQEPVQQEPVQQLVYQPPVQEPVQQAPVQTFVPPVQEPVQQPVQQPVYQPPVQEPVQQPVYQQPVYQQPVQQYAQQPVYQQPVQQPAPQKPDFELTMPAEKAPKKKGKGGKIVLAIVAVLLVVGIVLAAFNWAGIVRFFKRNFMEPAEYLQDVEKTNAATLASDVAAYVDAMRESGTAKKVPSVTISLEASDTILATLQTLLASEGADVKLDWIDSIDLDVDGFQDGARYGYQLGVGVNGSHLFTASLILDTESMKLWIAVPEVNETYLEVDMAEMYGMDAEYLQQMISGSDSTIQLLMDCLPSGQTLEKLINEYFAVLVESFEDVEKETKTVKVDGVKQELLVMTVELSQKDILKAAGNVLEKAKDDDTVAEVLDSLSDYANSLEETYETVDLNAMFQEALFELEYNLEAAAEEAESGTFLTIETYLDDEDQIVGRTITIDSYGEETQLSYITVSDGKNFAFKAEMAYVLVEGKGTCVDGTTNGSYVITLEGNEMLTVELEDFRSEDVTALSGTVRLIPEAGLLEYMDLDSSMLGLLGGNLALQLTSDGSSTVEVAIAAGAEKLLALKVSEKKTTAPVLPNPTDVVDVNDSDAGYAWLAELKFDQVLDNASKAGIPQEYMELLEALAEMVVAEFA